jgi:hypothetical protein
MNIKSMFLNGDL